VAPLFAQEIVAGAAEKVAPPRAEAPQKQGLDALTDMAANPLLDM